MEKSPRELHDERWQRVQTAMACGTPDRVPIPMMNADFHARYAGYTLGEVFYDADKLERAVEKTVLDFEPDCFEQQHTRIFVGRQLDLLDYGPMEWPGGRIGPDDAFQYLDQEIMTADEYDELLLDPSWYWLSKVIPRTARALAPLAAFPYPPMLTFSGIAVHTAAFGTPDMKQAMDRLHEVGKCALETVARERAFIARMAGLGFPVHRGGALLCPFDFVVDFLRGGKNGMLDMMRREDKLLALIDRLMKTFVRRAVDLSTRHPVKVVFVPLHWGIDGFMSPAQFKRIYWPQLRTMLMMLIDAGLQPLVFFEGNVTSRLEIIADVPPGKCTYQFETTDIVRAKDVLGGIACVRGGVPASLLISGSPAEVQDHVKMLIRRVGKGGGYIVDGGAAGIPREARVENVRAMFDTVKEHGAY